MGKLSIYKMRSELGKWTSPLTGVEFSYRRVNLVDFIRDNKSSIPKPLYTVALRQLAQRGKDLDDLTVDDMEGMFDSEAMIEPVLVANVVTPVLLSGPDADEQADWETCMPFSGLGTGEARLLFTEVTGYDQALFRAYEQQTGDVESLPDGQDLVSEALGVAGS